MEVKWTRVHGDLECHGFFTRFEVSMDRLGVYVFLSC